MHPTIRRFISVSPPILKNWAITIRDAILEFTHRGDQVECPICIARYREFAKYGNPRRKNARCIRCGSLERHRLIWLYINRELDLFSGQSKKRLLHFAPNKVFYSRFCENPIIDYVPCDLYPEIYKFKGRCKIMKADITALPFKDNNFDAIICSHVLEHIPDDRMAMKELYRVLKPDGWGIFQVPIRYSHQETYEDFTITSPKAREKAFGQYDHVRVYGMDYVDRLKSAGFQVVADDFAARMGEELIHRNGLMKNELIFFCTPGTGIT